MAITMAITMSVAPQNKQQTKGVTIMIQNRNRVIIGGKICWLSESEYNAKMKEIKEGIKETRFRILKESSK
jgi:hypothetical protein